jgi:serine/threonine protein kinase
MYDYVHHRAILIDFGLCSFFDKKKEKQIHNACGSIEYLAPEVITQTKYYATKNDAWALGITTYALLFGEFPYAIDDMVRTKGHPFPKKSKSVPLPGNEFARVSEEMRAVLSKLLCIDPKKRAKVDIANKLCT